MEDSGHSSLLSLHSQVPSGSDTSRATLDPLAYLWVTGHQPQPLLRSPPLCGLRPPQPSSLWPRVHAVHFLPLGLPWA